MTFWIGITIGIIIGFVAGYALCFTYFWKMLKNGALAFNLEQLYKQVLGWNMDGRQNESG